MTAGSGYQEVVGHSNQTVSLFAEDAVQFKLAILSVLAMRPEGRATLDELKGEVEALSADADRSDGIASALDDIDIFQSELVIPEDGALRITDRGRSTLQALTSATAIDLPPTSTSSHSLRLIDDLIGTEERLKIFDLELRSDETEPDREGTEAEDAGLTPAPSNPAEDADPDLAPEFVSPASPRGAGDAYLDDDKAPPGGPETPRPTVSPAVKAPDAPAFLARDHFNPGIKSPTGARPRKARLFPLIAAGLQQAGMVWRRHLERDAPALRARKPTSNVGGGAIALLTLLVLVICAGAVFALTQIRSLKSEVATLQRELSPLRERAVREDLLEKAKQNAEQQKQSQNKPGAEKGNAAAAPRPEQATFNLTAEEVRLVRDYIKPAPSAGPPAPAINVGDTVSIATIPLPSPLMEKIPQLLGARFTTRNGAIVILRRDSRHADIVLPPN
jgi:hypothetical protein